MQWDESINKALDEWPTLGGLGLVAIALLRWLLTSGPTRLYRVIVSIISAPLARDICHQAVIDLTAELERLRVERDHLLASVLALNAGSSHGVDTTTPTKRSENSTTTGEATGEERLPT